MFIMESAIIFAAAMGIVILFQLALAAGMPWGSIAMGGKYPGKYPPIMRAVAIIQIVILAGVASIVLSKVGLILPEWDSFATKGIWFVVGFSLLATILNIITKSVWERRIWAPISLILLITSINVAVG